jgi:hypothetical protein
MLGEKIGSFQAKSIGQRMLPAEGQSPKFETTVEGTGTILGVTARFIVTYWSVMMPDGSVYGEAPSQGVLMTPDGDTATSRSAGVGRFTGQGSAASFRGAVYYQGATGKLAPLTTAVRWSTSMMWTIRGMGKLHRAVDAGRTWRLGRRGADLIHHVPPRAASSFRLWRRQQRLFWVIT